MNIESVFKEYVYQKEGIKLEKKDIFYVFIELPELWEVRSDDLNGAVINRNQKMAGIYFKEPIIERLVDRVEWYNSMQNVYRIDYYGDYGYVYCEAFLNNGVVVSKSYYTPEHKEIIEHNISNGVVSLYENGSVFKLFHSDADFVEYCQELRK